MRDVGLDVGRAQVPGAEGMEQTNSLQHFNESVDPNVTTDATLNGMNGSIDHGWNWQLPTAMIAGGAASGGLDSMGSYGEFGDGARRGALVGAYGYAGQRAAELIAGAFDASPSTMDTAGAAGNIVGSTVGYVEATRRDIEKNHVSPGAIPLPEFVGRATANIGAINPRANVTFTGSRNLGMRHRT